MQILLISKTQKALDKKAFNYCHSLITLNRSHQKLVLNENTVLATDAKSQKKGSFESLVFNNPFESIRTQWNLIPYQSNLSIS